MQYLEADRPAFWLDVGCIIAFFILPLWNPGSDCLQKGGIDQHTHGHPFHWYQRCSERPERSNWRSLLRTYQKKKKNSTCLITASRFARSGPVSTWNRHRGGSASLLWPKPPLEARDNAVQWWSRRGKWKTDVIYFNKVVDTENPWKSG